MSNPLSSVHRSANSNSDQWKKPSTFYVKYEASHIDHEIQELQEEKEYLEYLRNYMIEQGIAKEEDLVRKKHTEHEEETEKELETPEME